MASPLISRCRCSSGGGPAAPVIPVARRPGVGAEVMFPNTGPVTVASGGAFPTFGAWVAVGAPQAADLFLTRLQSRRIGIAASGGAVATEFSYGAANTPLEQLRGVNTISDPTVDDSGWMPYDLNSYNVKLPANQQLYARISDSVVGPVNFEVWTVAWSGAVPTFTSIGKAAPAGAGHYLPDDVGGNFNVTSGAWPAFGAWMQVLAAAANNLLVVSVSPNNATLALILATGVAYQIGIGAAGAEVAVGTFITGHGLQAVNCDPPVLVLAGERVAIRAASAGANTRPVIVKVVDL